MRVGPDRPAVPPGTRRTLLTVAACAALVVVALGILVARTSSPFAVDDALLDAAGGWTPRLWTIALPIDLLGEPLGVVAVAAALVVACLVAGHRRLAVLAVAAQGVIWAATELVKPVVDRTIHGANLAYPSGHTAGTTAFALVVGLLVVGTVRLRRAVALLVVFGTALLGGFVAAWAQVVLGSHYATDTVGGFALALALVPTLALLVDEVADRLLRAPASDPREEGSLRSVPTVAPQVTPHPDTATYRVCDQAEGDR